MSAGSSSSNRNQVRTQKVAQAKMEVLCETIFDVQDRIHARSKAMVNEKMDRNANVANFLAEALDDKDFVALWDGTYSRVNEIKSTSS
mgnify:CR=1 FL=1